MKFPPKCPYCGKDIIENCVCETPETLSDGVTAGIRAEAHKCIHCNRYIYAFRSFVQKDNHYIGNPNSIMYYYPVTKFIEYPERVKKLSPDAYEIYKQTCNAKDYGLDCLLGAGIRMAVEHLVWQYLADIQKIPKSQLEGKTLGQLIPMLEGYIKNSLYLKVLKYFGNKIIHVTDAQNFTLEEGFNVFVLLLQELDHLLADIELEAKINAFSAKS